MNYTDSEQKALKLLSNFPGNAGEIQAVSTLLDISEEKAEELIMSNGLFDVVDADDIIELYSDEL